MKNAPKVILNASKQPYLSIGVRFGGIKAFGVEYVYLPFQDAFLRKDFVKAHNKHKKSGQSWDEFIDYLIK